jgi:DNA anti-recombination protein RmuC
VEAQQRRDAEVLHEVQAQSQAAAVSQLMEDVSSIKRQLALASRETQRRTEHDTARVDGLHEQLQAVCDDLIQARADMQGEHERTNTAMVELVEKIAEQFDAHDAHMKEMIESMASMRAAQADALAEIKRDLDAKSNELRREQMERLEEKSRAFDDALESIRETEASTSSRIDETLVPALEGLQKTMEEHEASLESVSARVEGEIGALEAQLGSKTDEMVAKFATYKEYVGRLRKELMMMQGEFHESRDMLIRNVESELDSAEETVEKLREHFAKTASMQ